ncbi:diguanylate cyclase (GGDEF)-like protein [Sphaerotilus hippei]|uniref:Diguanylate cyclase (GGDEF)-like protein n=1 Tax=Sphaerotilus hippei TaxID=744406 RepID=A0A318GW44_9BURK|nr:EAL domain-containing protein [Sphaerotilus hippei]PXW93716.1 diguanylate cyclase (GGDEF)-like protein [Sphaerotilus hippei]
MSIVPASTPDTPARRLLVLDADERSRAAIASGLRQRGFEVGELAGVDALRSMLPVERPADLIVLVESAAGPSAEAGCRQLRLGAASRSVPILVLMERQDEAAIEAVQQAGASDFLSCSSPPSALLGRIRQLLRNARTHLELERSRVRLAHAQDLARMGSFDWRVGPPGLRLEPEALRVLGHAVPVQASARQLLRLLGLPERQRLLRLVRDVIHHATVLDADACVQLPDGRERVLHIEAEPEFDVQGGLCAYTGVIQDVTDRRLIEDRVLQLANFDALTGLPNRRQLLWRAERALDEARRSGHQCALLLIDLDRFKVINDTLGHRAGDDVLVVLGQRLRACVAHSDLVLEGRVDTTPMGSHELLESVGRLGGDEFVALLPEVGGEDEAAGIAARMLEALREPVDLEGSDYFVTASVGVAVYPRDGTSVLELLRSADLAMYAAKAAGRNATQAFRPHLATRGRDRLVLETALHRAIERGGLTLHYQPKVDVSDQRVVGVEALMRWQRDGQLLQPADFMAVAEETGLIVPMGEWAIDEAARQVRQWRDSAGIDLTVAVNLPSVAFERCDLVEQIRAAAGRHGVPMRCLQLEITETGLMKDLQDVMPALQRLTRNGVEISIDDFGTGYSSLAYLTQLPISELKIDRSFVRDLGVTEQSAAVVNAIVALARSLGLRVIAEGVETERQRDVLLRLGCRTMQGFLFAGALSAADLTPWLRARSPRERA